MIIRIHIERLVVEGPVHHSGATESLRAEIAAAVERATRAHDWARVPLRSRSTGTMHAPNLDAGVWRSQTDLATGVARSVHAASVAATTPKAGRT